MLGGAAFASAVSGRAFADPGAAPVFVSDGDQLLARGVVEGEPCLGVLDNGVPWTILDRSWAAERDWAPKPVAGVVETLTRARRNIRISLDQTAERQRPRLMDLSIFGTYQGEPIRAVFGADMLCSGRLLLDAGGAGVAITPARGNASPPEWSDATTLTFKKRDSYLPGLPLEIEGAAFGPTIVDFASTSPIQMPDGPQARALLADGRPWSSSLARHIGSRGEIDAKHILVSARSIRIGTLTFEDVPVEIAAPDAPGPRGPLVETVIGAALIQRLRLYADFAAGEAHLAAGAQLDAPFRRNRVGLGGRPVEGGLEVMHVADNSPGVEAGLKAGDVIVAVDDGPPDRFRLRNAAEGEALRLKLRDGREVALTARRHF